jgi:hypothetical protein
LFSHKFQATLTRFGVGKTRKVWYVVIFLPAELAESLPFDRHPRLRIQGEIAGEPVEGAFIPDGNGQWYFIVSPLVRRYTGLDVGSQAEMRFRLDDPNRVNVPKELARELKRDIDLRAAWEALPPGKRRGIAYQISIGKTPETREKRVLAAMETIMALQRRRNP